MLTSNIEHLYIPRQFWHPIVLSIQTSMKKEWLGNILYLNLSLNDYEFRVSAHKSRVSLPKAFRCKICPIHVAHHGKIQKIGASIFLPFAPYIHLEILLNNNKFSSNLPDPKKFIYHAQQQLNSYKCTKQLIH